MSPKLLHAKNTPYDEITRNERTVLMQFPRALESKDMMALRNLKPLLRNGLNNTSLADVLSRC